MGDGRTLGDLPSHTLCDTRRTITHTYVAGVALDVTTLPRRLTFSVLCWRQMISARWGGRKGGGIEFSVSPYHQLHELAMSNVQRQLAHVCGVEPPSRRPAQRPSQSQRAPDKAAALKEALDRTATLDTAEAMREAAVVRTALRMAREAAARAEGAKQRRTPQVSCYKGTGEVAIRERGESQWTVCARRARPTPPSQASTLDPSPSQPPALGP